uniref:Nucleotide-binding oligomerization domain containing 2 n=1 Tax=Eptatretus burgeri TaxID=7764 RepID=A0A8C4N2P2_EPTBU
MRQTRRLGCAGCSQLQSRTEEHSSRRDAIIKSFSIIFRGGSAPPSPAPIGWTACRGSAFLRRTALALVRASPIGRKMTHTLIWREARTKRSMPIFGPSETLCDHIGAKSTPPGAWNSAHAHARMPASMRRVRTMPRAEGCCWGKNPIYKITSQLCVLCPVNESTSHCRYSFFCLAAVEKFKEKLRKHHEAATRCIRTYSKQEALELDTIFVEPCLQTIRSNREEAGPVTLPDLLPPPEVAKGRNVVVVSGDAGSGKSTLLLKLIRDWALKKSYGTFGLLFYFRCSDLSLLDCKVSLQELLFDRCCCPDIRRDLVIQRILKEPQRVLLCFDALDEFRQLLGDTTPVCASHDCQVSIATLLVNLLQGTLLLETTKVVTTRIPEDIQPLFSSTVARTVVVAGFTPEGVLTYQKHFPQNDDGRQAALDLLTSSPQIRGLCQLPIYSWIIAKSHSCIRSAELNNSSSCKSTLTTTEVLLSLVQVFLEHNMTTTKARCRVALFEEAKPAIWRLGKLALNGLVNGDTSFCDKDLNTCEIEESDLALGFVSKSRYTVGCDINEIFSFLHTTLQTFLAAIFLTTSHNALTLLEHFPNYQRPLFPFKFFLCGGFNAHFQKTSQLSESKKSNLKVLSHFLSGLLSKHNEKLIVTMAGGCHSLNRNRKTLDHHLQRSMRLLFRNLAASVGRRPSDMAFSTDHLTDDFLWLTSCAYEFGEEAVAKQLAKDIPVRHMKLHHMSLPPGTCTHLAYVLLHLPGRVELRLDNNFIGDLGVDQLLPCIDKFTELRLNTPRPQMVSPHPCHCRLFKNKLTDAVADDLARLDLIYFVALFFSSSRIGGNNFTSRGGAVIAKALKHNTRLKVIGLWGNSIGDKGAIAFAEVLEENNTLERLRSIDPSYLSWAYHVIIPGSFIGKEYSPERDTTQTQVTLKWLLPQSTGTHFTHFGRLKG